MKLYFKSFKTQYVTHNFIVCLIFSNIYSIRIVCWLSIISKWPKKYYGAFKKWTSKMLVPINLFLRFYPFPVLHNRLLNTFYNWRIRFFSFFALFRFWGYFWTLWFILNFFDGNSTTVSFSFRSRCGTIFRGSINSKFS